MNPRRRRIRRIVRATRRIRHRLLHATSVMSRVRRDYTLADVWREHGGHPLLRALDGLRRT